MEPSIDLPRSDRASTIAAVAVAALLGGAYLAALPYSGPRIETTPVRAAPLPPFAVALGSWTISHGLVTAGCPACGPRVAAQSELTVALRIVPPCGPYGCATNVTAVSVAPPFELVATQPGLPAPVDANGSNLSVVVRTPSGGAGLSLGGALTISDAPGPVVVTGQRWTPVNASGGDGGISVGPAPRAPVVAPGSSFTVDLFCNNSGSADQTITNLSVAPPFTVRSAGPGFPYEVDAGGGGLVFAVLEAPPVPGNYSVEGVLNVTPLPLVLISNISVSFVGASVSLSVDNLSIPTRLIPGEEFNGSLVLGNPSNASHSVAFNRTVGPWLFVNGTPAGTWSVPAHGSVRWFVTLSALGSPGSYSLGIVFTIVAGPDGPPRTSRVAARPPRPARARAPCGRAPRLGAAPWPRRTPG